MPRCGSTRSPSLVRAPTSGAGAEGRICQERGEHCLKLHSFFLTSVFFLAKIQLDVGVLDKSDKS